MSASSIEEVIALEAGLDALDANPEQQLTWRQRARRSVVPPIIAFVVFLAAWTAVAASGIKSPTLLPPPSTVWATLTTAWQDGSLQAATWTSVSRAVLGFALSVIFGTALGLLLSQWGWLRTALGPLISGLQSLPSATWLPAAVLWFGVGDAAVYTVVLCGAIPSIALGLVAGIDRVPPLFLRVGRVLGAGRVETLRFVVLPAALPGYVAGLRLGWAFAWRSLMAAELIVAVAGSTSSLGQLLDVGRKKGDMSLILAVIAVILVIGIAVEVGVFSPIERRLLSRRGLTGTASA